MPCCDSCKSKKAEEIVAQYDLEDSQLQQIIDAAKKLGFKTMTIGEIMKRERQGENQAISQSQQGTDVKPETPLQDFQSTNLKPNSEIGNINRISERKMSPFY